MIPSSILALLPKPRQTIVEAIAKHAATLLDGSFRFTYFTLHGSQHFKNLFKLVDFLIQGGLELSEDEAFLLSCAICAHDVGMVVPLSDLVEKDIFGGLPQIEDPAYVETKIRSIHHELIDSYVAKHFDFLTSLELPPSMIILITEISKCHRKIDLRQKEGFASSVGALLRIVDELDIGPSRAPAALLLENYREMDATSCWHWFKHNICEEWMKDHNVRFVQDSKKRVIFKIGVHPTRQESIPYWLTQIKRPVYKVLYDEGVERIIQDRWNVKIEFKATQDLSSKMELNEDWQNIEQKSLSAGRKVILVVDDEVRKMTDLFLPLMQDYHVIFSSNTKDALEKLGAAKVDLVIIDLQVGSGFIWTPEETQDFQMTGLVLCKEIASDFTDIKIGILTGSRHDLNKVKEFKKMEFLLKKPIDPDDFEKEVRSVLK